MFIDRIIYFIKRKILPGYRVGKNDLVIDIGSLKKFFAIDSKKIEVRKRTSNLWYMLVIKIMRKICGIEKNISYHLY